MTLTLVRVIVLHTLALPELDIRFLHNHYSDPLSDCRRLLGSTPGTWRYKGRLCHIKTHDIADPCGVVFIDTLALPELDVRSLHGHWADSGSDCGMLLGPMPASHWCMVHLSVNSFHEVAGLNRVLAIPELDYRCLYTHLSDPGPYCGGLLGSTPATQRYKERLCRI